MVDFTLKKKNKMAYKVKTKKRKIDKDKKWLNDWYKFEKEVEKDPFL